MFRFCTGLFLLAAAFFLSGLHWPILQGVAWAGMVAVYSTEQGSMREGLRQTFSGERPCTLCERIAEARTEEKTGPDNLLNLEMREKYVPAPGVGLAEQSWRKFAYPLLHAENFPARCDEPPTPVPLSPIV